MKSYQVYILLDTIILIVLAVFSFFKTAMTIMYGLTLAGTILLILMVFSILKDDTKTEETFDDMIRKHVE